MKSRVSIAVRSAALVAGVECLCVDPESRVVPLQCITNTT